MIIETVVTKVHTITVTFSLFLRRIETQPRFIKNK